MAPKKPAARGGAAARGGRGGRGGGKRAASPAEAPPPAPPQAPPPALPAAPPAAPPAANTTTTTTAPLRRGGRRQVNGAAVVVARNPGETETELFARLAKEAEEKPLSPTAAAIAANAPPAANNNNHNNGDGDDDEEENLGPYADARRQLGRRWALLHKATRMGPLNVLLAEEATMTEDDLRKHIDDWLDTLESAIRTLNLAGKTWPALKSEKGRVVKKPAPALIDISERKSTEPRWQRRQRDGISSDREIDPFIRIEVAKGKKGVETRTEIEDEVLASLWIEIDRILKEWIDTRGIDVEANWEDMLEKYRTYGSECDSEDRDDLAGKCSSLGLSTQGHPLELSNRLAQHVIATAMRRYGIPLSVTGNAIDALAKMEVPGGLNKIFHQRNGTKGTVDGPKFGASEKILRLQDAEVELQNQKHITVTLRDQSHTFRQTNIDGRGAHCFYRAVAHSWIGNETNWREIRTRALQLFQRALEPAQEGVTNSVGDRRRSIYQRMSDENTTGDVDFGRNMRRSQWGDSHTAQIVADALDIQIFMWVPETGLAEDGTAGQITSWGVQVRGRTHTQDRQVHLVNWQRSVHWTALDRDGDIGGMFTPTGDERTILHWMGENPLVRDPEELDRLEADDPNNIDLRPEARRPASDLLGARVVNLGGVPERLNSISSTSGKRLSKKRRRDSGSSKPAKSKKRKSNKDGEKNQ